MTSLTPLASEYQDYWDALATAAELGYAVAALPGGIVYTLGIVHPTFRDGWQQQSPHMFASERAAWEWCFDVWMINLVVSVPESKEIRERYYSLSLEDPQAAVKAVFAELVVTRPSEPVWEMAVRTHQLIGSPRSSGFTDTEPVETSYGDILRLRGNYRFDSVGRSGI